ncbi:MAG: Rrf2 family transcriptional regulator [Prosthecochloris sp.]|nr:Rrf2 family transcriptional regulator [Prosthecochloris sp.]
MLMKVLTKNTDYAIRALLVLGTHEGEYVSARQISQQQGIPYQFLRRILQELNKNGLTTSREGAHGGVRLEKNPDAIRVRDVIEIFQGKVELSECMFRKQICANRASCVLRHEIMRIEEIVSREFGQITLGKLLTDLTKLNATGTMEHTGEFEIINSGSHEKTDCDHR